MKDISSLGEIQGQIVRLAAAGLEDKEIAARLGLAPSTVRTYFRRLFQARGFHNRTEVVATWLLATMDVMHDEPRRSAG